MFIGRSLSKTRQYSAFRPVCPTRRKGLALMVVMLALSAAIVLSYAFVRTQMTMLEISRNGAERELALQMAQTGAALALQQMHLPDWAGVDKPFSRTVQSDASGTASFTVSFHRLEPADGESLPEDAALYVVVRSVGIWQSAADRANRVERTVEVTVRLQARLKGRTLTAVDSPAADDRAPNPGDYERIQQYALFAEQGRTSLVLDPGDCIDGDIWLHEDLRLYQDPRWPSYVRKEMLSSIGARYTTASGRAYPHPLAGQITFFHYPRGGTRHDLDRLNVPWVQADRDLQLPAFDGSQWQQYRLYEGGFVYQAVGVGSTLRNVSLAPTPDNPLGIFYRAGSVKLADDVTIRGTLVATGKVEIVGQGVHLGSYNWRGDDGTPLVSNLSGWPRLPAIVANDVWIARGIRATIDGAVVARRSFGGAGGDFEYFEAPAVSLRGTASARPLGQPFSLVQLDGKPQLDLLKPDGRYSIWLSDGTSGNWYVIVGVDRTSRQLTVVGEVDLPSTSYHIAWTRLRYVDIRGPVATETASINRPPAWAAPTTDDWAELYERWENENKLAKRTAEQVPFVDWLADPNNFSDWDYPHEVYGLRIEPTFHLRRTGNVSYQWSPPLLRPFKGKGNEAELSGYRWKVVSWRVLP